MRCTNKMDMSLDEASRRRRRIRRSKKRRLMQLITRFIFIFAILIVGGVFLFLNQEEKTPVIEYEALYYPTPQVETNLVATNLCVESNNVSNISSKPAEDFYGAGLFSLDDNSVLYAKNIHKRLYPASTTKIMTFYLGLKYGDLDKVITVSDTAVQVPWDSSKAYLQPGDQMTFKDLLYSMMLQSGNDAAKAVGEIISGSEEEFAKLMNEEARLLGATNSHFVNAHGFHDENHYTTVYDLYLIMNACLQYDACKEIVSTSHHTATVTQADGTTRLGQWWQTNRYLTGKSKAPSGVNVIGGKTGTTSHSRSCLVLLSTDENEAPYISIILGASSGNVLYDNMNILISNIAN